MTKHEIIEALWEAYKAGTILVSGPYSPQDEPAFRKHFDKWLLEKYPYLLSEETKRSRSMYWHEYGCMAETSTPHGFLNCTCNGQHPDGTYDHDVVCNAIPTEPIGGKMCSCINRRKTYLDSQSVCDNCGELECICNTKS